MKQFIYGAGGHGKVVWDAMQKAGIECNGFIDDAIFSVPFNLPIFTYQQIRNIKLKKIHLAIGDCKLRERVAINLDQNNFFSIFHPSASIAFDTFVDEGTFLSANSVIGPGAKIGKHCIINHAANLDHDCILDDFCHLAPHSVIGGGVKIGRGVLIGAGAIILPEVIISDYAVIGAGSVVTKNVEKNMVVIGNPARTM
jgi:sugar O-acyltransferase (sialic acid O-acetyltransferase NeuD family)